MEYQEILTLLQNNDCEVTFTKIDGSVRIMPCTLRKEALPVITNKSIKESKTIRQPKTDVVSAYCLDKGGWRSFKVANVTKIEIINA